jgi:hypothetical protein
MSYRAPERYQQQSSHKRKFLQKVNHLHPPLRTREFPKVVEDAARDMAGRRVLAKMSRFS